MARAALSPKNPLLNADAPTSGSVNRCTWARLEIELRESGCVKPNERVTCFVVGADGLYIYLETI